jgi:hypothetical protein
MSIGQDKVSYSIKFGLAPYFHAQLMDVVLKSAAYVICFDESLNKVTQEGQMDCYVRFFNNDKKQVMTRYITSSFLGHATANNMKAAFTENCKRLDPRKLLQISMDGPSVNLKLHRTLSSEMMEDADNPSLVDIGTCGLHTVHNAFKAAMQATEFGIDSLLSSLWWLLHDTPARREDFKKIIKDVNVRFPLKLCAHRWAENVNVIRRALDIWPAIEKYVKHVQEPHNAKIKPSSASYKRIEKAIHNPLRCRLQFALSLALQLHPFQTKFQSDWPLVPLLPEAVGALLTSVLARFIKHSVLQPAQNNWKELLKIDVSQCSNYRQLDDIDYGFSAKTSLSNLP